MEQQSETIQLPPMDNVQLPPMNGDSIQLPPMDGGSIQLPPMDDPAALLDQVNNIMESVTEKKPLIGKDGEDLRDPCPFFVKVGSCRHGYKCHGKHERPVNSRVILLPSIWNNPRKVKQGAGEKQPLLTATANQPFLPYTAQEDEAFQDFFEDVFDEVSKAGEIEDFIVSENTADHMLGHVFVKFYHNDDAKACVAMCNERYYGGRQIKPELSPVAHFMDAMCRQAHETGTCPRGMNCNFIHVRKLPGHVKYLREMLESQLHHLERSGKKVEEPREEKRRDRSRRGDRDRDRGRDRGGRDRESKRRRSRSRDRGRRR